MIGQQNWAFFNRFNEVAWVKHIAYNQALMSSHTSIQYTFDRLGATRLFCFRLKWQCMVKLYGYDELTSHNVWNSLMFLVVTPIYFTTGYCTVLYLDSMTMTMINIEENHDCLCNFRLHTSICIARRAGDEATWFNFKICTDLCIIMWHVRQYMQVQVYALQSVSKCINMYGFISMCISLHQPESEFSICIKSLSTVSICSIQLSLCFSNKCGAEHLQSTYCGQVNICFVPEDLFAALADRMHGHINFVHEDLCTNGTLQIEFWSCNQLVHHIVSETL